MIDQSEFVMQTAHAIADNAAERNLQLELMMVVWASRNLTSRARR